MRLIQNIIAPTSTQAPKIRNECNATRSIELKMSKLLCVIFFAPQTENEIMIRNEEGDSKVNVVLNVIINSGGNFLTMAKKYSLSLKWNKNEEEEEENR